MTTTRRFHAVAGAGLLTAAAIVAAPDMSAQRTLTQIPNPDARLELAALQPAKGFEINLFAAEPMLSKPIQMNFDAAGRLWVAGSSLYPQISPGGQRIDRVYVLEDTNGDGQADQSTVFADNLLLPTGIAPDDTAKHLAAYVANSSELLYLEDTDGDRKADRSTVVLSGFGTEDTHHIIHSFRWGPNGRLFFNQSLYIHSHVETPWGVRRLPAGGVWEYDPKTQRLEVYAYGGINLWGIHFDGYGQSFLTDGAFTEGITYAFPGVALAMGPFTVAGTQTAIRGLNPGQPKQSGLEIITGRHLPAEWQGRLLTHDFRANRTNSFRLEESGSGYVSRQVEDLVTTAHVAFRPVDVKMGPDGAVYIADWYNPIIQHGEVDFRDARRDHQHGRIWRVTATGRPLAPRPRFDTASVQELVAALASPELYTRERARPMLARHGAAAVLPALRTWVAGLDKTNPAQAQLLLEALWVCQWLNVTEPAILAQALASADHRIRAGALRVASDWAPRLQDPQAIFARAVADTHPQVRLEAVNALRTLGSAEAARAVTTVADQPMDVNLEFAREYTLRELAPAWLPRAEKDPAFFGPDSARLVQALISANRPEAVRPLVSLWRTGRVPAAHQQAAIDLMSRAGGPAELRTLFDVALDAAAPGNRAALLDALARAAAERKVRPEGSLAAVTTLVTTGDEPLRAAAMRLAGVWQVADARPGLVAAARAESAVLRGAALQALADLGPSSLPILTELASAGTPARRVEAVTALTRLDVRAAADLAAGMLASPDADGAAIAAAFLARNDGPQALAAAIAGRTIAPRPARAVMRSAASAGRAVPDLMKAVETAGKLEPVLAMPTGAALINLMSNVRSDGSIARGEEVYRRTDLACMACHAIGGAGGQVGPDLRSLGASAPLDYVIQALLDPQASIKEGYEITSVTKNDGSSTAGVLLRETGTELLLRDAANVEHRVPLSQVQSRTRSPISLMPPGLTATLREDELVDLLAFLSALGREKTVPAEPYVKRYALLEGGQTLTAALRGRSAASVAANPTSEGLPWHTVYARVDGTLPTAAIPRGSANINSEGSQLRMLRFELNVQRAGTVALAFNDPAGVVLYAGGQRLPDVKPITTFDLAAGRHAITAVIYLRNLTTPANVRPADLPLQIRLADAATNAAQVQVVNGD